MKVKTVVVYPDTNSMLGIGTLFENMPIKRGSVVYIRRGLYEQMKEEYEGAAIQEGGS